MDRRASHVHRPGELHVDRIVAPVVVFGLAAHPQVIRDAGVCPEGQLEVVRRRRERRRNLRRRRVGIRDAAAAGGGRIVHERPGAFDHRGVSREENQVAARSRCRQSDFKAERFFCGVGRIVRIVGVHGHGSGLYGRRRTEQRRARWIEQNAGRQMRRHAQAPGAGRRTAGARHPRLVRLVQHAVWQARRVDLYWHHGLAAA